MLAARLFGLEDRLLLQCAKSERLAFQSIGVFFLFIMLAVVLSFFYFFWLLLGHPVLGVIGAVVLGFVYFSLLRFTIITIGIPLHQVLTLKSVLLNPANTYRFLLMAAFIFSALVPAVSWLHHRKFTVLMNEHKEDLHQIYAKDLQSMRLQQLGLLQSNINRKKHEKDSMSILRDAQSDPMERDLYAFRMLKLDSSISLLETKYAAKDSLLQLETESMISRHAEGMRTAELPFYRFALVFKHKDSALVLILAMVACMLIIPLYLRVLMAKKHTYAELFRKSVTGRVVEEYKENEEACAKHLQKRYGITYSNRSLYLDPPFNTKPLKPAYKELKAVNLYTHYKKGSSL